MAKKAGAAKSRKSARARAKKAAIEEAKQEQEERPAETTPASEGKLRSFLRLIKKDDKPDVKLKGKAQDAPKVKASKPAVAKKDKRATRANTGREKPKSNFFRNAAKFFQSVWGELKKVHWPGRRELAAYSMVVITSVIFVAGLIWVADVLLSKLIQLLLGL